MDWSAWHMSSALSRLFSSPLCLPVSCLIIGTPEARAQTAKSRRDRPAKQRAVFLLFLLSKTKPHQSSIPCHWEGRGRKGRREGMGAREGRENIVTHGAGAGSRQGGNKGKGKGSTWGNIEAGKGRRAWEGGLKGQY